jgi:CRP-like cAMP-binding protein
MISRHSFNVYPFFAGLDPDHKRILAEAANRVSVKPGYCFFREGEEIDSFYLVVDGEIAIIIEVPDDNVEQTLTMQLTRDLVTKDITVSTVGPGEVFGWSALIPPHKSTAGAKATKPSHVIEFNCKDLRPIFKSDSHFAYLMTLKAAQIIRQRLRARRVEMVAGVIT